MEREGVIQFAAEHEMRRLSVSRFTEAASQIGAWRRLFIETGLLGACPARYDGLGFGNLSARVNPPSLARGSRRFLITGTQTGARSELSLAEFALVHSYSIAKNRVVSEGLSLPSSESITHGSIYDQSPAIRYVFHVHSPAIWKASARLRLPTSVQGVKYGTPQMAQEISRLFRETSLVESRVLAMGGHLDGVIGFGRSADEAGIAILSTLAVAYQDNS